MSVEERPVPSEWLAALERLMQVVDTLRGPHGCPWDQKQSVESLVPHLIEESHELADAAASGDMQHCREELGDLLMGVLMVARVADEDRGFGPAEVASGVVEKLIRRHPHVYGSAEVRDRGEVAGNWERIKAEEKKASGADPSVLSGVPATLPALLRAYRIGQKAAAAGFDWPDADGPADKVAEELGELRQAVASGNRAHAEAELGDLLFAVVNLARKLEIEPELALRGTLERFRSRFAHVEAGLAAQGRTPQQSDVAEMEALWEQAKANEGRENPPRSS